jgi:hypothetical protein
MMISLEKVLSRQLKPLCSRDNRVMKYESGGSRANSGNLASYHCGSVGCSVRYNSTAGYYMLMGMSGHAYALDEPGVNTVKCPIHGRWLYRRENIGAEPRVRRLSSWLHRRHNGRLGQDLENTRAQKRRTLKKQVPFSGQQALIPTI